jgi:putative RNA 2'-phosphotransferase
VTGAVDRKTETRLSKFMSLVLRHQPGSIGLTLDQQGWADLDDLIARARAAGVELSRERVEAIVAGSPKQRYALSPDRQRIRASQGHSIGVDLALPVVQPPDVLFHGTVAAAAGAIRALGLRRMERDHVHLSPDEATARQVALRRGPPIILRVAAGRMHVDGHAFYRSENGVWLVEAVPPDYLDWPAP